MANNTGTHVTIIRAGSDTGRTGTVATSVGMWNDGTSGDRVVTMDDTGERLVFEGWMMIADEDAQEIAYTHPTPRYVHGQRHATEVHVLSHRLGSTVQAVCGNLYSLHESPHTPDGVRLVTGQPITCTHCTSR